MLKYMTVTLCVAFLMPMNALACDAAGKNTHVGQLLSLNGNQFTIRDGQSGEPVRFTSHETMKGVLPAPGSYISVQYSDHDAGLIADIVK